MAESLKTIEVKIKKQVKFLLIVGNDSKRLIEQRNKCEREKILTYVERRLEILKDLMYERQERMILVMSNLHSKFWLMV